MSEYIVASSLIHSMDGWQLLGQAAHAHLNGDPDIARHMAYYAELRGAMSLLACQGIGVFDSQHFAIDGKRSVKPIPYRSGTHVFTWEALDAWISQPSASATVLSVVTPGGIAARDWLDAFARLPGQSGQIAQGWIEGWGLDLKQMILDRKARNLSSYRPTAFHSAPATGISQSLAYINDFWRLSEPSSPSGFATLDAYLLRQALLRLFKAQEGRSLLQARRKFERRIEIMVHAIGPRSSASLDWKQFLLGEQHPTDPILLTEAAGKLKPEHKGHDLQVIGRATLMLRLAGGACRQLLHTLPEDERSMLSFWWRPLAEQHGLWPPGNAPSDLSDLWADVEVALQDASNWTANTPAPEQNLSAYSASFPQSMGVLTGAHRAGMWSLGL
ncbi:MAG TPA: hypothetical protein VLI06_02920 [Solimonas sp.]|nr:hypothetical protein [Solimonas sp.]